MLPLTDHGSGVFSIPHQAFDLRNVGSKSGLDPWTPGFKPSGWNKEVILTNGDADISLLGQPRVDEWDNREGYTVLPFRKFRLYLYVVGELDAIFIGPVIGKVSTYSASIECAHVAVPTSSILPGFSQRTSQSSFHAPINAFASVIAGKNPIPHHRFDPSSTHVSFAPSEPLTRAEWYKLGYWISTTAASTTENVVDLLNDDTDKHRHISIAAPSLNRIEESGIRFENPVGVKAASPEETGLYQFENFTVVDPQSAA